MTGDVIVVDGVSTGMDYWEPCHASGEPDAETAALIGARRQLDEALRTLRIGQMAIDRIPLTEYERDLMTRIIAVTTGCVERAKGALP